MNNSWSFISLFASLFTITSCSTFTPPMNKPIIEDHSHDRRVTTFATIPSRRMVIVKADQEQTGEIYICGEPSADVSDNIASSMAAAVSGKGPLGGAATSVEAAASISQTLASTAQHLFKRTQGLQLYRDGMYNLCQARMNGTITKEEYLTKADDLLSNAVILIKAEIIHLDKTQPANTASSSGATTASSTATVGSATNKPGNNKGGSAVTQ